MFGKQHCSDELLLARLDGELTLRRQRAVKKHLNACWECRARLAELEAEAESVSRAFAQQDFPGVDRIEMARRKFHQWREEFELNLSLTPHAARAQTFSQRLSFAIAGTFLACVVGLGVWFASRHAIPGPQVVLANAQKVEESDTRGAPAVHQSFRIEVVPIQPHAPGNVGRLEVWSEPGSGRLAARWSDREGKLRKAVWRPERNRQYFYSLGAAVPLVSQGKPGTWQRASLSALADSGLDPQELELEFMKWLGNHRWRPVLLASNLGEFVEESGVALRAERVASEDHGQAIRLTAWREDQGRRVEVILDVDARSYRPRLETIRFFAPGRIIELRLVAKRSEPIAPEIMRPELFEPDSNLVASNPPTPRVTQPAAAPLPADLSIAKLAALEVDVLHQLDQVGAVLGEQVSVARTPKGQLRVEGVVDTDERKDEILRALSPFRNNAAVKLKVSTVAEAASAEAKAREAPESSGTLLMRELEVTMEPTAVFAELRRLFSATEESPEGRGPAKAPPSSATAQDEEIRRFAKRMLNLSQQALLHAWALKHFVERFSPAELEALPPDARTKWRVLVRDHAHGFREETEALRLELQRIFFAPPSAKSPDAGPQREGREGPAEEPQGKMAEGGELVGDELYQAIDRLFQAASAHDEALRSAFVISAESQSLEKVKSPNFLRSLMASERLARRMEGEPANASR